MSFALKRKESVIKGFSRLGTRQVRASLKALKDCEELEAVHEVRKGVKRLRALLRLGRAAVNSSDYRRCMGGLRRVARQLADARDAHVKVNALRGLRPHIHGEEKAAPFYEFEEMLATECRRQQAGLSRNGARKAVSNFLKELGKDLGSLRTKRSGWAAIAPGIRRSYRDGRCAYKQARQSGKPEDFHEWRKRAKDLAYQTSILCRIGPREMTSITEELERLGEGLGEDHDLFLLTESKDVKRFSSRDEKAAQALKAIAESRQRQLRSLALAIGARLYGKKPSVFCKRLRWGWKRWR